MSYPNTHIVKVSAFSNRLIEALGEERVLVNKLLRKHPLKNFDLTNPEGYVPMNLLYDFMFEIDRHLGPSSICALISDQSNKYKIDELGNYGRHITTTPNLLALIREGIKHEKLMGTNLSANFKVLGKKARYSVRCIDPPMLGKEFWEVIVLTLWSGGQL